MARAPSEQWPATLLVDGQTQPIEDEVVVEEPLEVRLGPGDGTPFRPLAITMRTPGHDRDLALGLLYAEALIERFEDVESIEEIGEAHEGRVAVRLRRGLVPDLASVERNFLSTSACGICGKTAVDSVLVRGVPTLGEGPTIGAALLDALPQRMRRAQELFSATGGIHAAALFDSSGQLLVLREDVGRHNAVDKVVGAQLREGALPLAERVLLVSGRVGFEIAQKALRAGVTVLAAVGAPSSLALRLAARTDLTLVGFLRPGRLNVYTGARRIVGAGSPRR